MNYIFALSVGNILLPIIVIAAFGALVWYLLSKKKASKKVWFSTPTTRAMERIKTDPDVVTPDGHDIYYVDGVPHDLPLDQIDRGIAFTFAKCVCAGYPANIADHHVKIVVLESEQAPESKAWSFRVPILNGTDPYYNSEWDMMKGQAGTYHYLLAAEQVVAVGTPYGDVFVLPYVPSTYEDKNYIARACSYSMEHICLAWYDGQKYQDTQYHTNGTGHPLIQACDGDTEL